jgi:hypothetical protein
MIAAALVTGLATEPVAADEDRTVALKATWFCGKSRNTRGAGGKLVSGESIALNNAQ